MPTRTRLFARTAPVALAAVVIAAGAIVWSPATSAQQQRGLEDTLALADRLSDAFSHVAEEIRPSVVSISAVRRVRAQQRVVPQPFFNSPFRDFFGDEFFERFSQPGPGREFRQEGQGSGFVISHDGYIVTNHHVVRDAHELSVRFADERSFPATVVGVDPQTDVAVLKIDASGLTPVTLGDSDALRVGQWVVAAGNPFGLSSTITAGIVSAKGRTRMGLTDYEDFIQTDAAINPGNSGGPLVNLRGEVVGINTAIFTRSGGYMGIGFAIPINMARHVFDSLIEDGRVVRGWLGVVIQDLDEGLAGSFGFDSVRGVLVAEVAEDSPASAAGLRSGDIITHLNGEAVSGVGELRLRVASMQPGREAGLRVFRDGEPETLRIRIGELPQEQQVAAAPDAPAAEEQLGVSLRSVTPDIASQLGMRDIEAGVVIAGVEPYSLAARAGLRPRDVITAVQNEPVADLDAFRTAMARHDLRQGVRLTVRSGASRRFVFIQTAQ